MKSISDIVVLFVDDEADTISALKRFLRKQPYRKAFAGSGREALEFMAESGADIVVTDAMMPGMSGQELIKLVKASFPDTLCLLVTGSNEIEQLIHAVGERNIFGFIAKPIEPEPFTRSITEAVEHVRETRGRG